MVGEFLAGRSLKWSPDLAFAGRDQRL